MGDTSEIIVRQAKPRDVLGVLSVEQKTWEHLGTTVYTKDHFETWLDVHPEGFLVAEFEGQIVGYTHGQKMNLSLTEDSIAKFTSCDEMTDYGFTRKTHDPNGNSLYGISTTSIKRGAGKCLHREQYNLTKKWGLIYCFGFPRISGFAAYIEELENLGVCGKMTPEFEKEIALWYAIECAKMVNGKIWDICPRQPELKLPKPKKPDPVLTIHIKNPGHGLAAVIPNFMKDPQSKNFATLCALQTNPI